MYPKQSGLKSAKIDWGRERPDHHCGDDLVVNKDKLTSSIVCGSRFFLLPSIAGMKKDLAGSTTTSIIFPLFISIGSKWIQSNTMVLLLSFCIAYYLVLTAFCFAYCWSRVHHSLTGFNIICTSTSVNQWKRYVVQFISLLSTTLMCLLNQYFHLCHLQSSPPP